MKKKTLIAVLLLLISALPLQAAKDRARLVGTWVFQREVDRRADGSPAPADASAPDSVGLLTYTEDGYVSVVIMPKGRHWETDTATIAELRDTLGNGTAYAGRYEVDEAQHTVTHIPAVTLEPAYEHKRLVRHYVLSGESLKLSGTFDYRGETLHFELTWVRPDRKENGGRARR